MTAKHPDHRQSNEPIIGLLKSSPDSHVPFLDQPFVNAKTWHQLSQIRAALVNAGSWRKIWDIDLDGIIKQLTSIDALATLARATMVGSWPSRLALKSHIPEAQESELQLGGLALHSEHTVSDDPHRHIFNTGPILDIFLGLTHIMNVDEQELGYRLNGFIGYLLRPTIVLADLLVASRTMIDVETLAFNIEKVLSNHTRGPDHHLAFEQGLAARYHCHPSIGPRHVDLLGLVQVLGALTRNWGQNNPVSILNRHSQRSRLYKFPVRVEPSTVWEGDHIVLKPSTGRFPRKQPREVVALASGIEGKVEAWSPTEIIVKLPPRGPSGPIPIYFSRRCGQDVTTKLQTAAKKIGELLPHSWAGSLFERLPFDRIVPPPPQHVERECIVQVQYRPRLSKFVVLDERGWVVANYDNISSETRSQTKDNLKLKPGSRLRLVWQMHPGNDSNFEIKANWGVPDIENKVLTGGRIPLSGEFEFIMPAHDLQLWLDIPGYKRYELPVFALDSLDGPREVCVRPGSLRNNLFLEYQLSYRADDPVTVEVDLSRSGGRLRIAGHSEDVVPFTLRAGGRTILFQLEADATERGPIPSAGCPGHEDERDLVPGWPADPDYESHQMVIRWPGRDGSRIYETKVTVHVMRLQGCWRRGGCLGLVAIHAALMPSGRVLFFGYDEEDRNRLGHGHCQLWDPVSIGAVQTLHYNPFCAGHALCTDGSLFVAGGHAADQGGGDTFFWAIFGSFLTGGLTLLLPQGAGSGDSKKVHVVRHENDSTIWNQHEEMRNARWYPTCITLANGEVFIIGGSAPLLANAWHRVNEDYEIFTPGNRLVSPDVHVPRDAPFHKLPNDPRQLPSTEFLPHEDQHQRVATLYNLAQLLPSNEVDHPGMLFLMTEGFAWVYDPVSNQLVPGSRLDIGGNRTWFTQASSVLLPIDVDEEGHGPAEVEIMIAGGGSTGKGNNTDLALTEATVLRYNVESRTLSFNRLIPLHHRRFMGDSILLPNGRILLVNGAEQGYANSNQNRVTTPELILTTPHITFVQDMEDAVIPRGYHSTALLLPDATVAVAGSTGGYGGMSNLHEEEFRVQIFEPPYLSCGMRPAIVNAPARLYYGQRFTVITDSFDLKSQVVLIRCSSTTHSLNTDQRLLRLRARLEEGSLMATMVRNPTYAPPGFYMLFVLSNDEVPSVAHIVRVDYEVRGPL